MRRLLIIVPNLGGGGQERVAINMARIMSWDNEVVIAIFNGQEVDYSTDCEVVDLKLPPVPGKLAKARNALRRAAALKKLKRERKIDVSVSVGLTANLANVLSRGYGKTIVRTSGYTDIRGGTLYKFIYEHSDRIICCAEKIREALVKQYPSCAEKALTVQNPYNVEEILQKGAEKVDDFTFLEHVIVTQGRLETPKNHSRLIKAFSLIRGEFPDAQLLILGEGTLRGRLTELIARYDLWDSVTLLGFRENPYAYLRRSHIYVLSSYHEGFPNALVEGMCFLPAVAVDCKSGPREILSNEQLDAVCARVEEADYGILVRPAEKQEWNEEITDDDRLLAEGILLLLRDPEKQEEMKRRAAMRAREFSFERFHEAMERVFQS